MPLSRSLEMHAAPNRPMQLRLCPPSWDQRVGLQKHESVRTACSCSKKENVSCISTSRQYSISISTVSVSEKKRELYLFIILSNVLNSCHAAFRSFPVQTALPCRYFELFYMMSFRRSPNALGGKEEEVKQRVCVWGGGPGSGRWAEMNATGGES